MGKRHHLDEHNLRRHLTPDVFVARGVGELDPVYGILRRQYRLWDEGKVPDLVYEGASPSTIYRDSAGKKPDYAAMGVREYVQFDPMGGMLSPRLQVFRLNEYVIYEQVVPEADGSVRCVTIPDYDWVIGGYLPRLRERATGQLVPTPQEKARAAKVEAQAATAHAQAAEAHAQVETARVHAEAARANAAEAEKARLRELLSRLQEGHPPA
ncbi:MAG TPA: Uma2 family endonuclease [Chloroflexota bacterium]|nr:Uma2 family endonuclease [Chloroflexota bacterium]